MELKYDVKRGADIYRQIYGTRFKKWILTGFIKRGDVVVWRSGLSGWRKPEDLEELVPFFKEWEKDQLKKKKKRKGPKKKILLQQKKIITNILIIDDEKDLCMLLSDAITQRGYNVTVANTKQEGIACLKKVRPDIVFLDLKLSDCDGISMIPEISKLRPKPVISIISAYGSEESKEEAEERGVYSFIDKPFTDETILKCIKQIAKGR